MNIYFSGIGGVGIGPLAEIALDAGYQVQGSDKNDSPLVQSLTARGVGIAIGQDDASFLQLCHDTAPIDWFVHTAALPASHPELQLAEKLGIKTAKRDELLKHIIADKNLKLIAITGTHGKTTTTGMLVWTLQQLGIPVSYSVGTTLSFGPSGRYQEGSEYFVYECDEFDRNFLHFSPFLSLITSVDYDHPDTYPTEKDYTAAFQQFTHQSSHTIMWEADATAVAPPVDTSWILGETEVQPLALAGAHNRRNGTLVLKAIEYLQIPEDNSSRSALERFPGTGRRFERLGENLYTDYGHHPVEIAATLQLASELSQHIVLVYQPHQNVRQHEIKAAYTDCFTLAEEIYWLPTYLTREDPVLPILTPPQLARGVPASATVHFAELDATLWQAIETARSEGKLVLCMGAGNIDAWLRSRLTL